MKIGVDMDDVLCDFIPAILEFHNEKFGTNLSVRSFPKTVHELFELIGRSDEEAIKKLEMFYESKGFTELKPIHGAKESLLLLKESGHIPVVITARDSRIREQTLEWIEKHFPDIFEEIHFADHSVHPHGWTKSEMCKKLGINYHIDDFLPFAFDCAENGINVFLLDKPWNQTEELNKKIKRVSAWSEICVALVK